MSTQFRNTNFSKNTNPVFNIVKTMLSEGFHIDFALSALELGLKYEGVRDLMIMWSEETDPEIKDELIADLQEEIDEESKALLPIHLPQKDYLRFDNLEKISQDIMKFKNQLKTEVERWGGISKLAKETGIPQSSLSRFFSSASMPRRSTLEKIAKAMNLQNTQLLKGWLSSK